MALALALPGAAQALSQTNSPGDCQTGGGAGTAWGNAGNAETSNNADATVSLDGSTSEALECTDFGFSIPAAATIAGIVVNVERSSSSTNNGGSRDSSLFLLGGTLTGSDLATGTTYTTGDTVESHGGATETWGNTWTAAQVNAAAFGSALRVTKPSGSGGAHTIRVDHVEITVYYSTAPPAPTLVSPANGATLTTPTPTFDWTDVVDPDGDTVTYEMQADNSGCGFASPEINATALGTSTYTPGSLGEGTYCWRARAVDQFGVASAWSATRNVTVDLPLQSQTRSPGNCQTGGGTGTAWSNADDAETSNNADATVSVDGTTSEALECTDYGFSIPAGAIIVGIEVNVERSSSSTNNGGSRDSSLFLLGGTLTGSDLATGTTYTTGDTVEPHGGAAETWGNTWTATQINAAAFGSALRVTKPSSSGTAHTVRVDHVEVTVYYVMPAPTLVSATLVCGTTNQVEVVFSLPVTAATAQTVGNYALSGGATISAAVLDSGGQIVTLTTSTLGSQNYVLTVSNIDGTGGGTIAANSQASFFSEGGYLSGLLGTYYNQNGNVGAYFTGTSVTRVDGQVDFNWAAGVPGPAGIGSEDFSVRWTGFVTASTTGDYTFRTRSDDGVRLYVDGTLVINNWTDHSATDNDSAAIALTAGQRYAVIMEFYERGGDAVAQLSWSGPGTGGFQFIPRASLSHYCGLPAPRAVYTMDETSWNGTAGEVADSSGNGMDGTAVGGAVPVSARVCNGGQFNGSNRYVQVSGLSAVLNSTASLAFWINTTQTGNNTAYEAPGVTGVEQSGGTNDIFWGWIDASGRIGVSVGDTATTKSTVAINDGSWHHVVLTRDHVAGAYTIYIDGTPRGNGAIAAGVTGTAFSSIGRIEDTAGTPNYFNGVLDEVRVYDVVLSQSDASTIMNITRPCLGADHYAIAGNTTAVNCDVTTVEISAHNAAHGLVSPAAGTLLTLSTTTGTGTWQAGAVSGSGAWTPSGANNGAATYVWPGGQSSFSVNLRHNTVAAVGINVVDGNARIEGEDLVISFVDSALRVTANGTSTATIGTQLSGKNSNTGFGAQALYLQAIRTDTNTGSCVGLIQNQTVTIQMAAARIDPTAGGSQLSVMNSSSAMVGVGTGGGAAGAYSNVSLTFDADSKAPLVLNYPNAGSVRLFARYLLPAPPSNTYVTGTSNTFVVRPFALRLSGPPNGRTGATSTWYARAGQPWPDAITVEAVAWAAGDDANNDGIPDSDAVLAGNAVTTSFGAESASATATVTHTLAEPSGGNSGTLTAPLTAFSSGQATASASWSEAGLLNLFATSANYMGTGQSIRNSTTGYTGVGRFSPDHFFVDTSTLTNRSGFPTCVAPAFTYLGESFRVEFTLQARNAAGGVTLNYATSNGFAKLAPTTPAQLGFGARSGTTDLSGRIVPGTSTGDFLSGVAAVSTVLSVNRNAAPDGPFANTSIGIAPVDSDGISLRTTDLDLDADNNATQDHRVVGTPTALRFGRLRLQSANGSERLALPMRVAAQYWNGTGFIVNGDDSCTTLAASNVALGNYRGNLASGETTAMVPAPGRLQSGVATVRLSAPGAGDSGSVDVSINLTGVGAGASCLTGMAASTGASYPWLQGAWCDAASDDDPSARATFGIYKAPDRIIYRRENY